MMLPTGPLETLLNDVPPKVVDFALILVELAVLQVTYSVLGRLLGFGDLL